MMKKRMNNRKFRTIIIPVIAIGCALSVTVTVAMEYYSKACDFFFGAGETTTQSAEGSEEWDADYYGKNSGTKDTAAAHAKEVSEQIQAEGTVLLKNDGALPLSSGEKKVACFGWAFTHPMYGGYGSNKIDDEKCVTPQQGLENAGFTVDQDLVDTYKQWSENTYYNGASNSGTVDSRPSYNFGYTDWDLPEMPLSSSVASTAATKSTVALIYISRQSGEHSDVPKTMGSSTFWSGTENRFGYNENKHYLELTDEEEAMIAAVISAGFKKVVVLINSTNIMECGELEDNDKIDAVLDVGCPGEYGFNSVAKILSGEINPSGRTANIYPSDFTSDPSFVNFSDDDYCNQQYGYSNKFDSQYSNISSSNSDFKAAYFVQYEEGIYVGYKYYETAYDIGKAGFDYGEAVTYPFGYGLSYTTFEQKIVSHSVVGNDITVIVSVKNTGSVAGKEVVQLYYTAPYGDETTNPVKLEKSTATLAAYAKTNELEAGESEEVKLTFSVEDMTSYDDTVNKCYVLDDGDYTISLRNNSHDIIDSFVWNNSDTKIYNDENDGARETEKEAQEDVKSVGDDYVAATNVFDDELLDEEMDKLTLLTRADKFAAMPEAPTDADRTASDTLISKMKIYDALEHQDDDAETVTTGANNGLSVIDMRGLDYSDPAWELLLDELTVDDMQTLIQYGYGNEYITSINSPQTYAADSPQCLQYGYWSGVASLDGELLTAYPNASVLARSYNTALAEDFGESIGYEALQWGITGWYGPGINVQRSPFGGRNFEYYSEDALLTGKMGANTIQGAFKYGLVSYVKHFALNEQEAFRSGWLYIVTNGSCIWATEQSIREVYLKPFEIAVKEAVAEIDYISDSSGNHSTKTVRACTAIMSSYTRIGYQWSGGSSSLLETILRDEWGFRGEVMTDYNDENKGKYMNVDEALRNGGDSVLATLKIGTFKDVSTDTALSSMRRACHNILYTLVNSNGVEGIKPGTIVSVKLAGWEKFLVGMDITVGVLAIALITLTILRARDEKKHPENYKPDKRRNKAKKTKEE